MRKLISHSLFAASASLLCSCASISTFTDLGPADREQGGLQGYYYLPRTIFNVVVAKGGDKGDSLTISRAVESDPKSRLMWRIEPSPLSDDTIKVNTDGGLLTEISSNTKDKSGEIAVKIAELIFTTASGGADLPNAGRALPREAIAGQQVFVASYDPLDPDEAHQVKQRMAQAGYCILVGPEVTYGADRGCKLALDVGPRTGALISFAQRNNGLFYRRLTPMPVRIYKKVHTQWVSLFIGSENMFAQDDIYQVEMSRGAFIDKTISMTFTSGELKKIEMTKPSEILAAVSIPVQIARIALAIPFSGLQQDKKIVDAQTDLLKSQGALITAQKSYLQLRASEDAKTGNAVINPVDLGSSAQRSLVPLTSAPGYTAGNLYDTCMLSVGDSNICKVQAGL